MMYYHQPSGMLTAVVKAQKNPTAIKGFEPPEINMIN